MTTGQVVGLGVGLVLVGVVAFFVLRPAPSTPLPGEGGTLPPNTNGDATVHDVLSIINTLGQTTTAIANATDRSRADTGGSLPQK